MNEFNYYMWFIQPFTIEVNRKIWLQYDYCIKTDNDTRVFSYLSVIVHFLNIHFPYEQNKDLYDY